MLHYTGHLTDEQLRSMRHEHRLSQAWVLLIVALGVFALTCVARAEARRSVHLAYAGVVSAEPRTASGRI